MNDNPTLPPATVLRALLPPFEVEPRHRYRSPEWMARVAREIARRTEAEIGSFPRGHGAPPEPVLRCLRTDHILRRS